MCRSSVRGRSISPPRPSISVNLRQLESKIMNVCRKIQIAPHPSDGPPKPPYARYSPGVYMALRAHSLLTTSFGRKIWVLVHINQYLAFPRPGTDAERLDVCKYAHSHARRQTRRACVFCLVAAMPTVFSNSSPCVRHAHRLVGDLQMCDTSRSGKACRAVIFTLCYRHPA
jgi:hypothetical protein